MASPNGLLIGESDSVIITGQKVDMSLTLNATSCAKPIFKGRATNIATNKFRLMSCKDISLVTSQTTVCDNDHSATGRIADKAPIMSIKLVSAEYDSLGGTPFPRA